MASAGVINVDVIVVGAGVVGSALGYTLGQQGRRVLVIEKSLKEPNRIVGELLQPGGVQKLREMGLEGCLQGIDSPEVHGYALFIDGKPTKLSYPYDKHGNLQKGSSFHHGKFISSLRNALRTVTTVSLIEGTATKLWEEGSTVVGVVYKTKENPELYARAPLTIVCDGCNSGLRSHFTRDQGSTSRFVGIIVKDTPLPHPNHGHVFLTQPAPVLAYQIGTHETRFLIDVPNTHWPGQDALSQHLLEVTAPQLPETIRTGFVTAVREARNFPTMQNTRLDPTNCLAPGILLLGDSFNMRHPLTGGGMTVGLSDAKVTADLLWNVDLTNTQAVTTTLKKLYILRKGYSSTINILSWALYHVFTAANDPILPEMRKACVAYLGLGGEFTLGPISLLAGLRPQPLYLMMHFFAVAIYGVLRILWPFPTPRRIWKSYRLLSAASSIVVPLVRSEKVLPLLPYLCRILLLTGKSTP